MTLVDIIEIVGSLLILAAFAATQARRLDPHSVTYLVLNVAGSAVLAVIAAMHLSWGFLLLEGTWAIVSTISLVGVLRRRTRSRMESRLG
jgi:hypothetical protein